MPKLIMEFIGTFFVVLTIGLNVLQPPEGQAALAPLAIGAAFMVMIFAGGHVSGAHYNPAVTLGVYLRGKLKAAEVPGYMIAQVLGAVAASFVVLHMKGEAGTPPPPETFQAGEVILAEFLFTFALVFVVLNVATAKGTAGNSFYGLAIGFTIMVGAYSIGNVSGCAINPAVTVGACLLKVFNWSTVWAYFAPQFLAGTAAAYAYKLTHPGQE